MKKVFVVACLFAVFFTACTQVANHDNSEDPSKPTKATVLNTSTTKMTHQMSTISTTVHTTPSTPSTQGGSDIHGMLNFVTERDYGSYCSLISFYKLPANFVTYEEIAAFGEFNYFHTLQSYLDEGVIPEYSYSLKAESGEIFKITITEGVTSLGAGAGGQITQLQSNDLRTIDMTGLSGGSKYIRIDDVFYVYTKGSLSYVQWEYDGLIFTLRTIPVVNNLSPWTAEGLSPVICNLLYVDTVGDAMETFKASMEAAAVK